MKEININEFNEELVKVLETKLDEIIPLVDSVILFATKHENQEFGTTYIKLERGNSFANLGCVQQWLGKEKLTSEEE